MKIKDFKEQLRNETFSIPDIYPKIKHTAYARKPVMGPLRSAHIHRFSYKRLTFAAFPVFMLALLIGFAFNLAPRTDYILYESVDSLKPVRNQENLNHIVKASNIRNLSFADSISSVFDVFTANTGDVSTPEEQTRTNSITTLGALGVLEPDIVKTDGEFIYAATKGQFQITKIHRGSLESIHSESFSNAHSLNEYGFVSDSSAIYSTDDFVVFLYHFLDLSAQELSRTQTTIQVYQKDQIRSSAPIEKTTYRLDGELVSSRLINNRLYVVSNARFDYDAMKVNNHPVPRPTINDQTVPYQDIHYLNGSVAGGYTIFSSIKLEGSLEFNTRVELGSANWNILYSTDHHMYLASNVYASKTHQPYAGIIRYTLNHLDTQVDFHSSLFVRGTLANQYALDEYNGYLRIAITEKCDKKTTNQLLVFQEGTLRGNKQMLLVGALSTGLGGPKESIKSIRFYKEEALVLTNHQTSNIYKINLQDPTNPTIESTLTLDDGSVSNLHYLNDEFAIGLSFLEAFKGYKLSLYQITDGTMTLIDQANVEVDIYYQSIEAIYNPNALYIDYFQNQYFVGFSVQELREGTYLLYSINPNSPTLNFVRKFSEPMSNIQRMVRVLDAESWFYLISDSSLVSYTMDFEPIEAISTSGVSR